MQRWELPKVRASVSVIMLFMIAAFFARSWFQRHLVQSGYETTVAADLSFFVMLPIAAVLMWPILLDHGLAMKQWFIPPGSWRKLIAYSVLLGLVLRIMYWAGLTAAIAFGSLHDENIATLTTPQFRFACPPLRLLALNILVMAVLTPVFEETCHRGFIFHALLPRGNTLAIFLSAALFGVMHRPHSIVLAFVIGLLLAVLTLKLRTLWGPILVHATFNLAAIFDWNCLHAWWNPAGTEPQLFITGGVATLIMLLGLVLVIWLVGISKAGLLPASRP